MKNILKFIILFLSVINNYGQEKSLEYLNFKSELLNNKKEIIIEYSQFCIGELILENKDGKICERPYYLFWSKNGKYFKRKFSDCNIFNSIELKNPEFIETVKEHINEIKDSEILPISHNYINLKGEEETVELEVDHYCKTKFEIHLANGKVTKNVNEFYLREKMIDEKTPNDNYEINQNSILNKIFQLVRKEIE
ncbi:hypothetical protein KO506_06905 [Polaribacter vadi]|uniref:hypothetical protein n=1 Tax=Polaribacter TaxID=52959 RepID=UPI001C092514|nr:MULTISPECIES: hypothetical protein [Polaribacter]MBU3011125.1 hypothetical protein [Polaribacter vadi]MDO6740939.1 hypothetical protein [Polaribacter sp. 1_MG-2023]